MQRMAAVIRRKLPFEKYGQRIDLVVLTIVFFDIRLGRIFGSIGVYASAAADVANRIVVSALPTPSTLKVPAEFILNLVRFFVRG